MKTIPYLSPGIQPPVRVFVKHSPVTSGTAIHSSEGYAFVKWDTGMHTAVFESQLMVEAPDPIAEGHNPRKLTQSQVEVADGWRLLTPGEIEKPQRSDVQYWTGGCWEPIALAGTVHSRVDTYRTQLPVGKYTPTEKRWRLGARIMLDGTDTYVLCSPMPGHVGLCNLVTGSRWNNPKPVDIDKRRTGFDAAGIRAIVNPGRDSMRIEVADGPDRAFVQI